MKKKILVLTLVIVGITVSFFPSLKRGVERKMVAEAIGGYPYQIGLTNVIVNKCIPACCTAAGCVCCTVATGALGSELCATKPLTSDCLQYSAVIGKPAGGMGSGALFCNSFLLKAGISEGSQLIAGGMSNVLMDQGVLGGPTGCAGCFKTNTTCAQ